MENELIADKEEKHECARELHPSVRGPSLILSGVVAVVVVLIQAYFQYHGKNYEVPEIVWTLVLAPWFGAAGGKVAKWFKKKA